MPLEIVTFVGGPLETNAYLVADTATGEALVIEVVAPGPPEFRSSWASEG